MYPDWRAGVEDVLRLSKAMTLKCALAELPHGGGKTVAVLPGVPLQAEQRRNLINDIAEEIGALGGQYVTGPDIGTSPEDMAVIYENTGGYAFCRPEQLGGSGNSSAATASGVVAALHAGVQHVLNTATSAGLKVGIIGVGSVGRLIGQALVAEGARVLVSDVDPAQRDVAERLGFTWSPADLMREQLDVLVPAATGGLLTQATAEVCRARLIVGPANNQLADDSVADLLDARSITWVPDVVASAGGIIHAVCREELGLEESATTAKINAISDKVTRVLTDARATGTTTLRAAHALADTFAHGTGAGS
jgi:leucine dehydrogenase